MTREEVSKETLLKINETKCLVLELITGFGKSKIAIDIINYICNRVYIRDNEETSVLILVSKSVHKKTWLDEFNRWGGLSTDRVVIECYESLKNYKNSFFDIVICDEMQHLSKRRLDILTTIHISEALIGLSATIKDDLRDYFIGTYDAHVIKCSLQDAVIDDVLPEPTVCLVPLELDDKSYNCKSLRFGKTVITTQQKCYDNMSSAIEYYKNRFYNTGNQRVKNLWLSKAGLRLKWLSDIKEPLVLLLLEKFKDYRTLTFCSSIAQTERLGKYNITSKNKKSEEYLSMFNAKKIKHITACNILNEGVNLSDCRIGIFCNLNASTIITTQRTGRLLRHKKPIIIIPYYKNTREEELMEKMIEDYNKDLIIIINNINNIKL